MKTTNELIKEMVIHINYLNSNVKDKEVDRALGHIQDIINDINKNKEEEQWKYTQHQKEEKN